MVKKILLVIFVLYLINTFVLNGVLKETSIPLPTTAEIIGTVKSVVNFSKDDSAGDYPQKPDSLVQAAIVRVVHGDTFTIKSSGGETKIRLIGVNTPETVDPNSPVEEYGKEASDYTNGRLKEGMTVELEYDVQQVDQYGRQLAYLWIGDEMFNATLVQEGYAQVETYAPNLKYVDFFSTLEQEAEAQGKGLWAE